MSHFAKIQPTASASIFIVTRVIVAEQDFINSGAVGSPSDWVQTSYNTRHGVHYVPESNYTVPSEDQSKALRANYACIGGIYDKANDVFYQAQPYPSWFLDKSIWDWKAPVAQPTEGGPYIWDETTRAWIDLTKQG